MKWVNNNGQNKVVLVKDNLDELMEREINGTKSRWIRCVVNTSKITEIQDIEIGTINVEVNPLITDKGLNPDLIFYNDVPVK